MSHATTLPPMRPPTDIFTGPIYDNEGTLRVKGRTTVRGRTAYRLVSKPRTDPREGVLQETVTYLVDARTYLPLEIRNRMLGDFGRVDPALGGRELIRWRAEYLRYERLPLTNENRALLRMGRHPGTRINGP